MGNDTINKRNTMSDKSRALEIIKKSGVLNPKMTLGEILEVSIRLDSLDIDTVADWTFISPNYVYKGNALAIDQKQTEF